MFKFRPIQSARTALAAYVDLFQACFPSAHHLDAAYLSWLYTENPDGGVVGFDAYDGDKLASHYACIPVRLETFGNKVSGLLSLNTATHPQYQGKGLFTQLAARTYDSAAARGYSAVYGVANANSTHGFVNKLGFTLVSPLEARIGFGASATVNWPRALEAAQFRRIWDSEGIRWRCRNPANVTTIIASDARVLQIRAKTDKPAISAWASVRGEFDQFRAARRPRVEGTLFLGLLPENAHRFRFAVKVPTRLRPSPLNFIYKPLSGLPDLPEAGSVICSFLDFDAY